MNSSEASGKNFRPIAGFGRDESESARSANSYLTTYTTGSSLDKGKTSPVATIKGGPQPAHFLKEIKKQTHQLVGLSFFESRVAT